MRRAPGPSGSLLLGNVRDFRSDPISFLSGLRAEYGDVARFRLGKDACYLLSHPDHVRWVLRDNSKKYRRALFFEKAKVLLGNGLLSWAFQDDFWRHRRRTAQPVFYTQHLRRYADHWADATRALVDRWRDLARAGSTFDAFAEMTAHSQDLAARSLFSIRSGTDEASTIAQALSVGLGHIMRKVEAVVDVPEWIPTPSNRRFLKARAAMDALILRLIAERRQNLEGAPQDLLTTLISSHEESSGGNAEANDRQLRDDVLTLFLAGFETTAAALAFSLWLFARHPDHQAELTAELDRVLGDRTPGYDDLDELPTLRRMVEESLRLFPPGWWIPRSALEVDEIDGYRIPAGATIILSPYVTHRHPDFWERPEEFDPSRFTAERSAGRPVLAYFPFGDGPRSCIGGRFSMIQLRLVLAIILQHYRVETPPNHTLQLLPGPTARPRGAVPLKIQSRG